MVLKDDPYSNEAGSAAGLTPKTGHNQSHGASAGAIVTKLQSLPSPGVSSVKIK